MNAIRLSFKKLVRPLLIVSATSGLLVAGFTLGKFYNQRNSNNISHSRESQLPNTFHTEGWGQQFNPVPHSSNITDSIPAAFTPLPTTATNNSSVSQLLPDDETGKTARRLELESQISTQFDVSIQQTKQRLNTLESQLQAAKTNLANRIEKKENIIVSRKNSLLGHQDELAWDFSIDIDEFNTPTTNSITPPTPPK